MAQQPLDEFHRLVADGRYREARGILESTPDIAPDVAEKWLLWLDELHREEWRQAGIVSDSKKQNPQRARDDLARMIGGTLAALPVGVLIWLLVGQVLTYQTASVPLGAVFLLAALVGGFFGWKWTIALFISAQHSLTAGAAVTFSGLVYLLTSGIPLWYAYEPALSYRLVAFALLAPAAGHLSYRGGAWGALRISRLIFRQSI
jgi:hypothetical protein